MVGIKTKTYRVTKFEDVDTGERKKLLVGSVFATDNDLQRQWLDLQLSFLNGTTHDFDHVAILYNNTHSGYFSSRTETIRLDPVADKKMSKAHTFGLNTLKEIFRSRRKMYRNFLFMDSDAFPIRTDWQSVLDKKMEDRSAAFLIRSEELETRAHASVLYLKESALDNSSFTIGLSGLDLIGCEEYDVFSSYFEEHREEVFSLVRSNQLNIHPVLCGVYYDCFYHHGCGSADFPNLRSNDYWDVVCKAETINSYTERLMSNPEEFVGKLAGWTPERYLR